MERKRTLSQRTTPRLEKGNGNRPDPSAELVYAPSAKINRHRTDHASHHTEELSLKTRLCPPHFCLRHKARGKKRDASEERVAPKRKNWSELNWTELD